MKLLLKIDEKLSEVIPKVMSIENRLNKLESVQCEVKDIKSATSNILAEVRGVNSSLNSLPDISNVSEVSDSLSDTSYQSDQGSILSVSEGEPGSSQGQMFGLFMADSDMTELAASTGELLNCQVSMFNYRGGLLDPSLFSNKLEFVILQDSGQMLDKYSEVTTDIIQEIKAHVQELVNLSVNILQVQPETRVFIGSLPPRYDGRVRVELARAFNSLLVTESFMEERIIVTSQSQLTCRNENKLLERYETDKVTLTSYGNHLRAKNTAAQIAEAVSQLKIVNHKAHSKTGVRHNQKKHPSDGPGLPKSEKKLKQLLVDVIQKL